MKKLNKLFKSTAVLSAVMVFALVLAIGTSAAGIRNSMISPRGDNSVTSDSTGNGAADGTGDIIDGVGEIGGGVSGTDTAEMGGSSSADSSTHEPATTETATSTADTSSMMDNNDINTADDSGIIHDDGDGDDASSISDEKSIGIWGIIIIILIIAAIVVLIYAFIPKKK